MALSINDVKSGLTILVDAEVYLVIETQHVKPGKGAAFVRAKLRNLRNGGIQEKTFRGDEKIDAAFIEERKLQYQYFSGTIYHFMDQDNYEEISISEDSIGDKKKFLKDNLEVMGYFYKNETLNINLPNFIEFKIIHTEPGIKGDTAKSGTKPAQIETGANIQVPLFIDTGDKIKVDTRTGEYIERVYS
ncbi:MAG: elongation factor P [Candidatus Omnitrophica bacterium]|nr:elongation factor P [Candidatus Omnitrophota bacterium]MDD5591734.1 elongation factor P [Candidatus Omnitrophota bacterium]